MIELATLTLSIGALLYHSLNVPLGVITMISATLIIVLFLFSSGRRGIYAALFLGVVLLLGALLIRSTETTVDRSMYGKQTVKAVVLSVDKRLAETILIIKDEIRMRVPISGNIEVLPNDTIVLTGIVQPPKDFITDTGRIFPYEEYLGSKGIQAIMDDVVVVSIERGNLTLARIAAIIRHSIAEVFSTHVSFPVDGVLAGMLVGYQGGLPQITKDLFRDTGVLHVLVLSGYNIMLFAGFMVLLLRKVPFRLRVSITIAVIVLIVLISGSGVASVRAGIMGSIALLSGLALKTYRPLRALVISYIVFFIISPLTIFSDPGFHLSFLATLFMITVLPKAHILFAFVRHNFVRELVTLAVCIPVFMLPYTMYFSGLMPLATIPANIVLALVIPILMVLGVALLALSCIPPLAGLIGILVSFISESVITFLEFVSLLPIVQTPPLSWWGVLLIYAVFFIVLYHAEIKSFLQQLQSSLQPQTNSFDA